MRSEQTENLPNAAPVVMLVLDGWGIAPDQEANALTQAQTPTFDHLVATYPATALKAYGEELGYYFEEKPDIRSNYFCLGTGGPDNKPLFRINSAIDDDSFFYNRPLLNALKHCRQNHSRLHIIGMASEANIHSSWEHLKSLIKMSVDNNIEHLYLHLILDGVDSAPNKGLELIKKVEKYLRQCQLGEIATISGRFYALDRDNHWNRTTKFYNALIKGVGRTALSASESIKESYDKHIFDKEFYPTIINDQSKEMPTIKEDDSVIIANIRGDRWRQIVKALVLPGWDKIPEQKYLKNLYCASFTKIEEDLPIKTAFPARETNNSLASILDEKNYKQLKISGSEKFGLLTYDFNGRQKEPFANEDRELVSKDSLSFEVINPGVVSHLLNHIKNNNYHFILSNFVNLDRAAARYNFPEIIKIVEAADSYLKKIVETVKDQRGTLIITAGLGNIEELYDIHAHAPSSGNTYNNVPFIIMGKTYEGIAIEKEISTHDLGLISPRFNITNVAPTILKLMGLTPPKEMRGKPIL